MIALVFVAFLAVSQDRPTAENGYVGAYLSGDRLYEKCGGDGGYRPTNDCYHYIAGVSDAIQTFEVSLQQPEERLRTICVRAPLIGTVAEAVYNELREMPAEERPAPASHWIHRVLKRDYPCTA